MSPTIYGLGSGKFNRLTIQYPAQMRAALKDGVAGYVGDGAGVWDFVHIEDLAALYETVVLDWVEGRRKVPVGENGWVFSGTGSFSWKEVAERIAEAGVEMGVLREGGVRSLGLKEAAGKWIGGGSLEGAVGREGMEQLCELGLASNSRTRADVARELGWRPERTRGDWERSFREEFEEVVREK